MTVLSAELVQSLARQKGGGHPVVSLYLNVDGKQRQRAEDYRLPLEGMVKEALAKDGSDAATADLSRIQDYVTNEFERGNIRGLAIFSAGDALWEIVTLPVAVDDHLVVNMTPHVRQLETILDNHETIGVLMTDKQRSRLLVIDFGRVVEREEILDPLPRHDDDKGDWRKDHIKAHSDASAQNHLRHAAQAMFDLYQRRHFDHLMLCVAEELKPELVGHLHDYLKTKVMGRSSLPMTSSEEDVIAAAEQMSMKTDKERKILSVEKLRAAVATNAAAGRTNGDSVGAVAGLDHTLKAIFEKRVDTLLVSEGYKAEGWRCADCSHIATMGRKCQMCGSEMVLVDDVVEEAVEDAISQKCRVEFCSENADLDVLGRIGALLRF